MEWNRPARPQRRRWLACLTLLALAPQSALALPRISEVLYDAAGADNGLVFVELYGVPGSDLNGLALEGVNGADGSVGPVLLLAGQIPADGLFVVADDAGDGSTSVPDADLVLNFDFQNGPDSIVLRSGSSVLDALGYGVFDGATVFAGEGQPAPDPPAGWSLARRFADVDSDDNAADFVALETPTPGTAPLMVPEPGAGALVAGGLCGLAWIGRRPRRCP